MAKQTFTAGQVLTAAQMETLQTNDFNQSLTTKTANYTLVVGDAGTTILCNSATPFTITFPASVFAANDTLKIVNQNAGVVTVAAGAGAALIKAGNSASTTATLNPNASATIRVLGGSTALWEPTYNTFVDGCETGLIGGGVISVLTAFTVTFAVGRFNVAPIVSCQPYAQQRLFAIIDGDPPATTTGFTVNIEPIGPPAVVRVAYIAIQQGTP